MMTRTPIAPERTPVARPAGAGELPTGGEAGPGFGEALDAALEPGAEAAQAAAAAMAPQPAPVAPEGLKGKTDPAAALGAAKGEAAPAAAAKPAAGLPGAARSADAQAGAKLASVLGQGDAMSREGAATALEERSSGRLEAMLSQANPWDRNWIREGMPRPDAEAKADKKAVEAAQAQGLQAAQAQPISMAEIHAQALGAKPVPASAPASAPAALKGLSGAKPSQPGVPQGESLDADAKVERLRVFSPDSAAVEGAEGSAGKSAEQAAAKTAPKVFGGSEFLSTLNTVKGGEAAADASAAGQAAQAPAQHAAQQAAHASQAQQAAQQAPAAIAGAAAGGRVASRDSLREVGGSPIRRERETGKTVATGAGVASQATLASPGAKVEVSGQVVPGPMAKDRLATASVSNLSAGIRDLKGQGGGEVKLRLNPDHLGELQLHVTTRGDQVSVKVHASSEHAREVLEESLSALKESLAGHKLTLGKIEIVSAGQQAADSGMGNSSQHNGSQLANDFGGNRNPDSSRDMGGDGGRGQGRDPREDATPGMTTAIPAARRMAASAGASRGSGRLDVMA